MVSYIGLDAHSKTCLAVVVDAEGREVGSKRFMTSEAQLLDFVRSLPGKRHLTFEESNLSRWLYGVLQSEVEDLLVCNPSYLTRRSGPKNDYADAFHLAQQLRGGFLTPVYHGQEMLFELRALISGYQVLMQEVVRVKNRLKALFRSQASGVQGARVYRQKHRVEELLSEVDRFVAQEYFERLEGLKQVKKRYQEQMKQYQKRLTVIQALDTIPELGVVRSCIIAAVVVTPKRFANKHKFWSYCELVRHEAISDGKKYGKRTIRGNRLLKGVFMSAAQGVLAGQSALRRYYEAQIEQGVEAKAARKNLARKIASIALAVMKTQRPYNDQKIKESIQTGKL